MSCHIVLDVMPRDGCDFIEMIAAPGRDGANLPAPRSIPPKKDPNSLSSPEPPVCGDAPRPPGRGEAEISAIYICNRNAQKRSERAESTPWERGGRQRERPEAVECSRASQRNERQRE